MTYPCFCSRWKLFYSLLFICATSAQATTYIVASKSALQSKMNAAIPGDTVIVANGTYNNWGSISFTNNNGSSSSAWIVLRAETFREVVFTGNVNLQFKGTHVRIDGFVFAYGNAGTNAVVSFRSSSSNLANYCRISNIVIDNFNTPSSDSSKENEWIGIFGTHNRVDHCTFINKYNARATVVVWYSNTTYPAPAVSTYHSIDSNYFSGRSYQGSNGGETIRVGDSNASRTDGFNTVEYNLFEGCTQDEPEIISNKSDFNVYRYNTFKNYHGGLTLRHGRYCSVYSNFFIVDDPTVRESYGIRIIDKGHKVFNNYLEGLNGNKNSLTSLRCPIIMYDGLASTNDTTDASKAAGYFPADSSVVAFNTIVNCSGGAGIVLGFTDGGSNTFQPKGIVVANNLIKMTTGQAAYNNPSNSSLTYFAEGNIYNTPNGLGLSSTMGFTNQTLNFGGRTNGILSAPSLVQDAAVNTAGYMSWLNDLDAQSLTRSAVYDVGCSELNGTGIVITYPLDSNLVGAGKPQIVLPVHLISFKTLLVNRTTKLTWEVANEMNFKEYKVEWSGNGERYNSIGTVAARGTSSGSTAYTYLDENVKEGKNFYRIKMIDKDNSYNYSPVQMGNVGKAVSLSIYPNPAQHSMTVDLNGTLLPQTAIIVIDAAGRVVKKMSVNANSTTFSIAQLAKGLYRLQVIQQNVVTDTYPFIIH